MVGCRPKADIPGLVVERAAFGVKQTLIPHFMAFKGVAVKEKLQEYA